MGNRLFQGCDIFQKNPAHGTEHRELARGLIQPPNLQRETLMPGGGGGAEVATLPPVRAGIGSVSTPVRGGCCDLCSWEEDCTDFPRARSAQESFRVKSATFYNRVQPQSAPTLHGPFLSVIILLCFIALCKDAVE